MGLLGVDPTASNERGEIVFKSVGSDAETLAEIAASSELSGTFAVPGFWADGLASDMRATAPPINTPVVTYFTGGVTAMSSPVVYAPAPCNTGAQKLDWNGATTPTEPNFYFHPGRFRTSNGGSNDLALYGELKPNGASQAAYWPIIAEFDTSAGVNQLEVVIYGTPDPAFRIEVNGLPIISDNILIGPSGLGLSKTMVLTFPDARVRRIRLYMSGDMGLRWVRVPTGQTISKPTGTRRVGAIITDSFGNGSGSVAGAPVPGAGIFDTFALRVLKALGCDSFILGGIGGSGFVTGAAVYSSRVSVVLAMSPNVLVTTGSVNDGTGTGTIQSAVASHIAATTTVPERYLIGTMRSGYEGNHDAVKAAADAADVPFIDMRSFLNGTGNAASPNGSGNGDIYLLPDGVHPTFLGQRAIERRLIQKLARA